ncbi:hypothetical protein F4679DRAFT_340050 [Xylaria curta]|nr:hypothetical protein F4679DRAFT_340050 [Xylaria curta]
MAPSPALLGPLLGAVLGAFGTTVAAVIGAFVAARLNRPNTLVEQNNGDAENLRDPTSANRSNLQDRPSVAAERSLGL